ncbi:hypothetical protein CLOM_g1643 [Closterium sp. NIES-68]|nr:hypothetical protein CLOM_g1643 [Closterium sp. NIES-68]GJP76614.1 hypothetical protein CLOP_g7032 [Closterium sp. NIES-67]
MASRAYTEGKYRPRRGDMREQAMAMQGRRALRNTRVMREGVGDMYGEGKGYDARECKGQARGQQGICNPSIPCCSGDIEGTKSDLSLPRSNLLCFPCSCCQIPTPPPPLPTLFPYLYTLPAVSD